MYHLIGKLSLLSAMLLLSACDGGGGGAAEPAAPMLGAALLPGPQLSVSADSLAASRWGYFGPFDDWADQAPGQYSGKTGYAPIKQETIGPFVNAWLHGAVPVSSEQLATNESTETQEDINRIVNSLLSSVSDLGLQGFATGAASDQTSSCSAAGTVHKDVSVTSDRRLVIAEAENCKNVETTVNGRYAIAYNHVNGQFRNAAIAFDDLAINFGERRFQLTGAISTETPCLPTTLQRRRLHVVDIDTGRQLYFDTRDSHATNSGGGCYQDLGGYTQFSGSILDSENGRVELQTRSALAYSDSPAELRNNDSVSYNKLAIREDIGLLNFQGLNGQSADFQWLNNPLFESNGDRGLPHAALKLNGADSAKYNFTYEQLRSGALVEINNEANAPISYAVAEQQIEANFINDFDEVTGRNKLLIEVDGGQDITGGLLPLQTYEVSVSGGAKFDITRLAPECEWVSDTTLTCHHNLETTRVASFQHQHALLIESDGADVQVTAKYVESTEVAQVGVELVSTENEIRYQLIPASDLTIETLETDFGSEGETRTLKATVRQLSNTAPTDVLIDISSSDGIALLSAELVSSGSQALISRCTTTRPIQCTMDAVREGDALTLSIDYRMTDSSDQTIDMTTNNGLNEEDLDPANNQVTTQVTHIESTAALQTLVDAATDGDNVTLPAGTYLGGINIKNKKINIVGAALPERTILVSTETSQPLLINAGARTTIGQLTLQTTGALVLYNNQENVTIADSIIEPLPGQPHSINRLVSTFSPNSYRLKGNLIRNWGVGDSASCDSLINDGSTTGSYMMWVFLEQNVFDNNQCKQLLLATYASGGYNNPPQYFINNNTFIDNPTLFSFRGPEGTGVHRFHNNIVVGASDIISVDSGLFINDRQRDQFVSSRNLVWESDRKSLFSTELVDRPGIAIDTLDIHVDPNFVDADNGDYRLLANSPAIDAGVAPASYDWTYDNFQNEDKHPIGEALIQARDGNGDGVVQFDLGAFEYLP